MVKIAVLADIHSNYLALQACIEKVQIIHFESRKGIQEIDTEPHHLILLSAHRDFPGIDLDREQNIVSLCSNCHNVLHYGASYKEVLHELYVKRNY